MKHCVFSISIVLASCVSGVAASEAARAPDRPIVEMSPYKVISRGWNVYWSLSFPILGRVAEVFFREVDAGSFAGKAGIKEGDQLLRINGKPVKGMKERDMEGLLWPSGPVTFVLEVQASGANEIRSVELRYPELSKSKAVFPR